MNMYLITGENDESIDDLVDNEELEIIHRFKHIPAVYVAAEQEIEALQEQLPKYQVSIPKKDYDTRQ